LNNVLQILQVTKRSQRIVWVGLVAAILTACGTVTPLVDANLPERFDFVTTINIDATATQVEVETAYDATAVVFRPEAGFAVLGFDHGAADELTSLAPPNQNQGVIEVPEVSAEASGWTAWSGGWTAWSGGWTAWSGGWTAWSGGGEVPSTFGENLPLWDLINLPETQALVPSLGAGVKVAVIDTGIDLAHAGFSGKLAPAGEWMDYVDGDNDPMDEAGGGGYGHGTGVAGVVLQVAPNAIILPIRVLTPDGSGDMTNVLAAIDHAVAMGADIINLSLGSITSSNDLKGMIKYASDNGVLVISSSGNSGDGNVTYPANYAESVPAGGKRALSVGSVSSSDIKSPFSTYGYQMEVYAPGEYVYTLAPDQGVTHWSGTSFAAPMVSGVLALAIGGFPDSPALGELASYINNTSVDIDSINDPAYDAQLGHGRLNAEAFMVKFLSVVRGG
jgi:hypothetical protein